LNGRIGVGVGGEPVLGSELRLPARGCV